MKTFISLIFILSTHLIIAQRTEREFQFNSKKFIKEYQKSVKTKNSTTYPLEIIDIKGNPIIFDVIETQISAEKIPNIYTFKGKSQNGNHLISLTINKSGLTGSYSDNGREIYIEPIKKKCNKHIVYDLGNTRPQVGQSNDFIK